MSVALLMESAQLKITKYKACDSNQKKLKNALHMHKLRRACGFQDHVTHLKGVRRGTRQQTVPNKYEAKLKCLEGWGYIQTKTPSMGRYGYC